MNLGKVLSEFFKIWIILIIGKGSPSHFKLLLIFLSIKQVLIKGLMVSSDLGVSFPADILTKDVNSQARDH